MHIVFLFKIVVPRLVSENTDEEATWQWCSNEENCIWSLVNNSRNVEVTVTTATTARYVLNSMNSMQRRMVRGTHKLFRLSSGWLYNRAVDEEYRKKIDSQLIALRISGTVS